MAEWPRPGFALERAAGVLVATLSTLFGCGEPPSAPAACPVCVTAARRVFYPALRFSAPDEGNPSTTCSVEVDSSTRADGDSIQSFVPALLASAGLVSGSGRCAWQVRFVGRAEELSTVAAGVLLPVVDNGERYAFITKLTDGIPQTRVFAPTTRAARYALDAALAMPAAATAIDWPSFRERGEIEGYYGAPLSSVERISTLRRMDRLRQNTYLYAPKNDVYSGVAWRLPYPPSTAEALRSAADYARAHQIDFIWGVAPGLYVTDPPPGMSIHYSSDANFGVLTNKIDSVRKLGINRFALLLDDALPRLVHDNDRTTFPSLAAAHVALINRLSRYLHRLGSSSPLLVVGTAYSEEFPQWRPYLKVMSAEADSDIEFLWTGPSTFPRTITVPDLSVVDSVLERPVTIWDNWPLQVEPTRGRSSDLPSVTPGLLSNMMLQQNDAHPIHDTWVVMGPVADYSWNTQEYAPEASLTRWQAQVDDFK